MYTREQRQRAIDTFIRFGHSYAATARELGYPSETCLRGWWADYEARGCVVERAYHREPNTVELIHCVKDELLRGLAFGRSIGARTGAPNHHQ